MEYGESIQGLISFLEESPTAYHAVEAVARRLETVDGFIRLQEGREWRLEMGKSYFTTRNGSSLIAFRLPRVDYRGFQMTMSHADSPAFKLKGKAELAGEHYVQLDTERYGGAILSTWLDRPLQIAGRAFVRESGQIVSRLVRLDGHVVIPNLAIHMNREVNNGAVLNPQTDLLPLYGDGAAKGELNRRLAAHLGVQEGNILGSDLYLVNDAPGCVWGPHGEYYSCGRIDDLACAYAAFTAFERAEENPFSAAVYCLFDNEEIGSGTRQGARSTFLSDVLRRIHCGMGRSEESYFAALRSSFMVSADNAHAVHPNHPEKCDPLNRCYLNGGLVVKQAAGGSYATDGAACAVFREICRTAEVPVQYFANRSDMPSGSTMGCCIISNVSVNTVDIGLPQLAMHSSYETAGCRDADLMIEALTVFYGASVEAEEDGRFSLTLPRPKPEAL